MDGRAIFRFWRPTLIVVGLFCAVTWTVQRWFPRHQFELATVGTTASLVYPHPDLTPEQVVRLQIDSLAQGDRIGLIQCVCFASPANLSQTGPIGRFADMVRRPPYNVLCRPGTAVVGTPVMRDDSARLLVSLLHGDRLESFVWILTKQRDPPYAGCWMSDAVLKIQSAGRRPNRSGLEI